MIESQSELQNEFSRQILKLQIQIRTLDGRTRAIVIAESLARVIAAILSLAFVGSHVSPQNTETAPH